MNEGVIQQIGTPMELYDRPANRFVASFIGSPTMNFFSGDIVLDGSRKFFNCQGVSIDLSGEATPAKGPCILGVRPEAIKVLATEGREAVGKKDISPKVTFKEPHGHEMHMVAQIAGQQVIIRSANPHRLKVMERAQRGAELAATLDREALHWFDDAGSRAAVLN